jgi:hypothetical protein
MTIKITNCTTTTGGGKGTPTRIRTNQNVHLLVSEDYFDDITPQEVLDNIRYRNHHLKSWGRRDFIVTHTSKIQIV